MVRFQRIVLLCVKMQRRFVTAVLYLCVPGTHIIAAAVFSVQSLTHDKTKNCAVCSVLFTCIFAPLVFRSSLPTSCRRRPQPTLPSADMFFSTALLARAAKRTGFTRLTTKRAKKGYYKGKGAISTGRFTKAGRVESRDGGRREFV